MINLSKLIAIDAGHGGTDPGATSNGVMEKDIVLAIAIKLKKELLAQGFRVYMTRESDVYDSPLKKAQKANTVGADAFVSIHCNSASNASAEGTETLAYDTDKDSGMLAKAIQKNLIKELGLRDRGVKERKDLTVLNSTKMTAVLVETAFISNDRERNLLISDSFQSKVAKAICKGVCEFFKVDYKEDSLMTAEQAKKEVKEKLKFDDRTMLFLDCYKFADALFIRIAENLK